MFDALKKIATQAGLRTDDDAEPEPKSPPQSAQQSTQASPPVQIVSAAGSSPSYIGAADSSIVNSIKDAVIGASPVLVSFLATCEKMKKAFPNDESARMRAALAMTDGVDKNTLLGEIQRTVAAALTHAKAAGDEQRKQERDRAVGSIEREMQNVQGQVTSIEADITRLETSLSEKRTRMVTLQGEVRTAETSLQQQEATVKASFAEVDRTLALLSQTFNQL